MFKFLAHFLPINYIDQQVISNMSMAQTLNTISTAISEKGFWKIDFSFPLGHMPSKWTTNDCFGTHSLMCNLLDYQVQGVIILRYMVKRKEDDLVEITITPHNIRCENGHRSTSPEKHFPSRISAYIRPMFKIYNTALHKSARNTRMSPWTYEQQCNADNTTQLHFLLHDTDGEEVCQKRSHFVSRLRHHKAWFHKRDSNLNSPFTRDAGVIFSEDQYPEGVTWLVHKDLIGSRLEVEIKGVITMTYWPNRIWTFYTDTREIEFTHKVQLHI